MTEPVNQLPPVQPAAPQPAKKKHRFLKFLGLLSAVIVAIAIGISAGSNDSKPLAESKSVSPGAAKADKTPGVGDEVKDGDFTFTVTQVDEGKNYLGEPGFGLEAQGKFLYVSLTVVNHGDEPGSFFPEDQFLFDTKDRKASASGEAGIYLDKAEPFYSEINPGNTIDGLIIFDVDPNAVPDHLELHDSLFSGGVTVNLK